MREHNQNKVLNYSSLNRLLICRNDFGYQQKLILTLTSSVVFLKREEVIKNEQRQKQKLSPV